MEVLKLNFRKLFFIQLLFLTFLSCNKKELDDSTVILFLIKMKNKSTNVLFFFKTNDSKIFYYTNNDFEITYNTYYSKYEYKEFLTKVMKKELALKPLSYTKKFNYISLLESEYNEIGSTMFLQKYCKKTNDKFLLSNNLTEEEKVNIMYNLSKDKIYFSFDDYSGFYIGSKW